MNFGKALEHLETGRIIARNGWNGKGIHVGLKVPEDGSEMTSPYLFIDTTGLQTKNPEAPKSVVPWLASQTDILAKDWTVVEKE